ncbi:MAG: response regulator transcription factor, partial [Acidobacteriaceae bacterium]|nr:response regulator transcription factor [Acidobacteriaceae bacterium]
MLTALPNSNPKLQILVADPAVMSCHSLAQTVHATCPCDCIPVSDSQEALRLLQHGNFDVALIALEASFDAGFVLQVHRQNPDLAIVALLDSPDRPVLLEAFASGARGVLYRSNSFTSLSECIRAVCAGQVWACSAEIEYVLDALVEHAARTEQLQCTGSLSKREEEIAHLVAQGKSNRQISAVLGLSEHTIKNYLFRIFEKLGVSSRVELTLSILGHAG